MKKKNEIQYIKSLMKIGFIEKYKNWDSLEKWLNQVGIFTALIKPDHLHINTQEVHSFSKTKLTLKLEVTDEIKNQLELTTNKIWLRQKDGIPQNDNELIQFMENSNTWFNKRKAQNLLGQLRSHDEENYLSKMIEVPEKVSIKKLKQKI